MQQQVNERSTRYKILATLGTGGFATVYRAEDSKLGRDVALKILHPHLAANQSFVDRFRAEARAAARLRHNHIVTIHDVGETADGRPFLVMGLLEGVPLVRLIAQQAPLAEDRAILILSQLADALDYLHRQGLVHRDVKPANVMVHENDAITLMDFGIARSLEDTGRLTKTGELVGTVAYMAPEQLARGTVGPATDIYSLGVLAYELFAGRPPFTGSPSEVIDQQRFQPPPPLSNFNPNVSSTVRAGIESALAKDPAARPATARALVEQLGSGDWTESEHSAWPAGPDAQPARSRRLGGRTFSLVGRSVGAGLLAAVLFFDLGHIIRPLHGTPLAKAVNGSVSTTTGAPAKPPTETLHSATMPGSVLASDKFDNQNAGILPRSAADPAHWEMGYLDGEYHIAKIDPSWDKFGNASTVGTYADAIVDVDARIVGETEGRSIEIGCRSQTTQRGENEYRLTVIPATTQFILWREDNGTLVQLTDYQASSAIQAGIATNHLQLICDGSTITVRVNGTQLASVQDSTYRSGHAFIRAGVLGTNLPATVDARFGNLVISKP